MSRFRDRLDKCVMVNAQLPYTCPIVSKWYAEDMAELLPLIASALHHLDCVTLEPDPESTDWERVEAAKDALRGVTLEASAGKDGVFV